VTTDRLKAAFADQYYASLAMFREVIERCPDEDWTKGSPRRKYWRIVWHTLFFTHFYLSQSEADFERWPKDPCLVDPDYFRNDPAPLSKADMLEFCDYIVALVEPKLAVMDLEAPQAGFSWYDMPKLEHQFVNIRHIHEHGGQLRDRLLEKYEFAEEELDWIGSAPGR
jgi:hypothetical protein